MTGFLLVVMGVGGCIGVATSFLLGRDETATSLARARIAPVPGLAPPGVDAPWAPSPGDVPPAGPDAGPGADGLADEPGVVLAPPRARRLRRHEGEPYRPAPWWQRLRSALGIVVIAFTLGAFTAAAIGIVAFTLFTLLRGAVG